MRVNIVSSSAHLSSIIIGVTWLSLHCNAAFHPISMTGNNNFGFKTTNTFRRKIRQRRNMSPIICFADDRTNNINFKQQYDKDEWTTNKNINLGRRKLLEVSSLLAVLTTNTLTPTPAIAASDEFRQEGKDFTYTFVPPSSDFKLSKKPLQTHLDEINFVSEDLKGYQIGITVDPIRIQTLKDFGTPDEVAAKVVTAEVNRDGVFKVTLFKDTTEDQTTGSYEMNYISEGKRGNKHFVVSVAIQNQKIYVVTGQIKDENYNEYETELLKSVRSFKVVS